MRRFPALAALAVTLGVALSGCGALPQDSREGGSPPAGVEEAAPDSGGEATPGTDAGESSADERRIIATGWMRVTVSDPAVSASEVATRTEARGGHVENRRERTTDDGRTTADLTLRVPAEELDDLMTDLGTIGEIAERNQSTEDVTGTVRDLDARIRALEVSTERLEGIMAEADSSADLLETERALSERQAELESLIAQRNDLGDAIEMSTLDVELRQTGVEESRNGFLDGLSYGWQALLNSLIGLLVVIGALLPWAVALGVPAFILVWLIRRRLRRGRRAVPPSAGTVHPAGWPSPAGAQPSPHPGGPQAPPRSAGPQAPPQSAEPHAPESTRVRTPESAQANPPDEGAKPEKGEGAEEPGAGEDRR